MRRYFFHVRLFSGELVEDQEGTTLADLDAAKAAAAKDARALIGDALKSGNAIGQKAIEIADDEHRLLAVVDLHELIERFFPG